MRKKFKLKDFFKIYFKLLADPLDKEFSLERASFVVWALGKLDSNKEPSFHTIYPKRDLTLNFNASEQINDCFSFTVSPPKQEIELWDRPRIFDKGLRVFNASIGPSGGSKGYAGITKHVTNSLAWYINGLLSPELYLRRGLTYAFKGKIQENKFKKKLMRKKF